MKSDEVIAEKKRKNGRIPEWPNGADCKSAGLYLRWFESIFSHNFRRNLTTVSFEKENRSLWKSGFEASERRRRELPRGNDRQMREAQRKRRLSETRKCGSSSVGRALAFQAKGRGFEPRRQCSSGVERFLGKEEVESSNLSTGSAFFVYNTH